MRSRRLLALLTLASVACAEQPASDVADAVYTNGRIYTVDEAQPWAEAVAIKDGNFLVVGSNADVAAVTSEATAIVDLEGAFVMPGLIDAHVHPMGVAEGWANVKVENPSDVDAILTQISDYAAANPNMPIIRGEPWNLGVFEGDSPRKELLDEIVPDRPAYFVSQTGHSAWVNSKALELAGITKDTPNGGKFVFDVDPETGEPSGTVREFAMGAVERILTPTDAPRYAASLGVISEGFSAYGYTSLKSAEGELPWLEGARYLEDQGGLTLRLFPAWHWRAHYSISSPEDEDRNIANWREFESELISPRYVKMFYDGGPDSYTAYLLDDYVGRPGDRGAPNRPREEILDKIAELNATGLGVLVHVIGDAGARDMVDIFEEVRARNGSNGIPMHLSHAWLARPEDFARLASIEDACIDFSPALGFPADEIAGSMAPPLGEERYQQFFNARSAFEAGVPTGFGSDWASSLIPEPNAFFFMQTWVTRQDPRDPSLGAINPDQGVTVEQAIRGYTLGGAECIGFGWEDRVGSIEAGKLADFIVLDRNPFEIPIEELYLTEVDLTLLGGDDVFDRTTDVEPDLVDDEHFEPGTRYME